MAKLVLLREIGHGPSDGVSGQVPVNIDSSELDDGVLVQELLPCVRTHAEVEPGAQGNSKSCKLDDMSNLPHFEASIPSTCAAGAS